MGETESIASSQADRGTHHWASRKKMDQIIFGVQNQTEGVEGGVGWGRGYKQVGPPLCYLELMP